MHWKKDLTRKESDCLELLFSSIDVFLMYEIMGICLLNDIVGL
jgi:hypothetical protein